MKIVLFTQRVELIESYNERRDCADQRIVDFLRVSGYLPIPIPNDVNIALNMVERLCPVGIVLTGGNSLVKYGGDAPERDAVDKELISLAVSRNIPLFGFCRGMQSILDYFSNDLVSVEGHVALRHEVYGDGITIDVNSYHNQGCLCIKNTDLKVDLRAEDGVIEQVEHKQHPIVGIMWHPEREEKYKNYDMNLLKELFR